MECTRNHEAITPKFILILFGLRKMHFMCYDLDVQWATLKKVLQKHCQGEIQLDCRFPCLSLSGFLYPYNNTSISVGYVQLYNVALLPTGLQFRTSSQGLT